MSFIRLIMLSLSFGLLDATNIVSVAKVVLDILGLPFINKTLFFSKNTEILLQLFFYFHQQKHDF